ncbi:MAG: prepilin-type N-terminal cleavage/methylation domain-containing protein, partial [Candidatus Omnitrophota bacterium]
MQESKVKGQKSKVWRKKTVNRVTVGAPFHSRHCEERTLFRHCEERSDEAISYKGIASAAARLRNDGSKGFTLLEALLVVGIISVI